MSVIQPIEVHHQVSCNLQSLIQPYESLSAVNFNITLQVFLAVEF